MNAPEFRIRKAKIDDCLLILDFIKKLAKTELFPYEVSVTQNDLEKNLFSSLAVAEAIICNFGQQPIGFAVYYTTFSTTTGKNGLHLDDLFIEQNFHGRGYGKRVIRFLAEVAKSRDCARFEWWALKTNEPAIQFYQKLGARQLKELDIFRLNIGEIDKVLAD